MVLSFSLKQEERTAYTVSIQAGFICMTNLTLTFDSFMLYEYNLLIQVSVLYMGYGCSFYQLDCTVPVPQHTGHLAAHTERNYEFKPRL